jgi:carbon-monoxide dehydrogenase large subunit
VSRTVLGHTVLRTEDPALLTGEARFVADLDPAVDAASDAGSPPRQGADPDAGSSSRRGAASDTDADRPSGPGTEAGAAESSRPATGQAVLHAVFVRSMVAHGRITGIETEDARSAPGVHSVWSGQELGLPPQSALGREPDFARPRLVTDRVRYVGEPVAVVLAESPEAALDASELVIVNVDPLPAVTDPVVAAGDEAPLLFPEHGSNVVGGRHGAPDDTLFDGADVVVRARLRHNRMAPVPLEPNGCLAVPEGDGRVTVWASTQSVFGVRDEVAKALGLQPDRVRVRAPWIGGGFGAKGGVYVEQVVVAALACRTGRPVRWVESRSENLVAMTHGRAQVHDIEVGADRDGRITALRVRGWADVGAYPVRSVFVPLTRAMASGVYAIPKMDFQAVSVVTNTTPIGPYRGAGRPEAAALTERAVDLVADELGLDPVEVRRRNFPDPAAFPFTTAMGTTYDTGDYAKALDEALRLADYETLRAEQRELRAAGSHRLLGIGVACYVETTGRGGEFGSVRVEGDGNVTVTTGSVPHGQGHETAWAQIAAEVLGVPFASVRVRHSDTAVVDHGIGTFGSRSTQLAGSAVHRSASEVRERARRLAAEMLEAAAEDVVVTDDGGWSVAGVPARAMSWGEVASEAARRGEPLVHAVDFDSDGSYPFGCHVAVVEGDRDTGRVELRSMVAVDDCGRVVNPLLAEGQVHGGLAQGIAQILFEGVQYDGAGNPLTTSLVDYLVPSAADLPSFVTAHTETPTPRNPLGAKGIGESGTTGSISAVWNAVIDALEPFGVRHLDPPFTPEVVWRAVNASR